MQETMSRPAAQDFTRDVYPVYQRWASKCRVDDETRSVGLALCWYDWSKRKTDYPPSHWARLALRKARCGRDLPIHANDASDIWARLARQDAGGMGGLGDRRPGPARLAISREQMRAWEGSLGAREKHILALAREGAENREIARVLGVTPTRISQIKGAMIEAFYGWGEEE